MFLKSAILRVPERRRNFPSGNPLAVFSPSWELVFCPQLGSLVKVVSYVSN